MTRMSLFRRRRTEARPSSPDNVTPLPTWNDPPETEEILQTLQEPLPPGRLEWNRPTLCPRCEDWGYIDHLDLIERVMRLHCPTCHFHWEITEAQIEAHKQQREPEDAGRA
jgi:hypothetical protein